MLVQALVILLDILRNIVRGTQIWLTGGAEMATTPLGIAGFNAAKALSTNNSNPEAASRPWIKIEMDLSWEGRMFIRRGHAKLEVQRFMQDCWFCMSADAIILHHQTEVEPPYLCKMQSMMLN